MNCNELVLMQNAANAKCKYTSWCHVNIEIMSDGIASSHELVHSNIGFVFRLVLSFIITFLYK